MKPDHLTWRTGLLCLLAFFVVWALRATVLYGIDEAIPPGVPRSTYSALVKIALWVLPALLFTRFVRRQAPCAYLGLAELPDGRAWGVSALITALYLAVVVALEVAIGGKSFVPVVPSAVSLVFLVASCLTEEVLFRGLILCEFASRWRGVWANLLTSLLFVAIHWPHWLWSRGMNGGVVADSVGVFLASLLFGVLYLRTRSIWPAFAAHVANNLVSGFLAAAGG